MIKDAELDSLKQREQEAFRIKQEAFTSLQETRKRTCLAYDKMHNAWEERCLTRQIMNQEYEAINDCSENYRKTWGDFNALYRANSLRIEALRFEADYEHQLMQCFFNLASDSYKFGDKSKAPEYSAQGKEHKAKRNKLNAEIKRLNQEIRDAKAEAIKRAPKISVASYRKAKKLYEEAKARHIATEEEFKRLKDERDHCKMKFESAQDEHLHLKAEFQARLDEIKRNHPKK